MNIQEMIQAIEHARGNPARLEELYCEMTRKQEHEFKKAMVECVRRYPDDVLYRAWELRLEARREKGMILELWLVSNERGWIAALLVGILLGLLFFFIAQGSFPLLGETFGSAMGKLHLRAP